MDRRSRNLSRDNHYLPQALLERWSGDGVAVWAYRLLVSDERVPEWIERSISGTAYQRDLYTLRTDEGESDHIEAWFANEFERPGLEATERAIQGQHLSEANWTAMIRFVALQHLRTPQSFLDGMKRWEKSVPSILEQTTRDGITSWKESKGGSPGPLLVSDDSQSFAGLFNVRVEPDPSEEKLSRVTTEVTLGRQFWLASVRHLLGGVARKLLEHQWSLWEAAPGYSWPITDDPSLRLNYYGRGQFDFDGGWGRRGSELMMPISPRCLLYTQVGKPSRRRHVLSVEQTMEVQHLLVKRAYRWVFATAADPWIAQARPRIVDATRFRQEQNMWERWHDDQLQAETEARDQPRRI